MTFRPLSGNLIFQYPLPHLPVPQGCQGTLRGKEIFMEFLVFIRVQYPRKP